jgi:hypothetical protein
MVDAVLFAVTLLSFVLGISCMIMGLLPSPAAGMREKVEYSFFGITSLIVSSLFLLALTW